jgi:long-chain fatty acid transport protein
MPLAAGRACRREGFAVGCAVSPRPVGCAAGRQFLHGILWLIPILATPATANNGLNLIGFGTDSALMAGADTAVARDTTALNTNPAGLANIGGSRFDIYSAAAYALDVAHADRFGNDAGVSNEIIALGGAGFARRLTGTDWVVGIGFFVQGGAGAVYEDLATPFGNRDELSALFGIAKITPGVAWQASDTVSVGAGLALIYAHAQQRIFPDTSVFDPANPGNSFFGSRLDDADALEPGLRLGVQFRPTASLSLGAVYANRVALPLRGGRLTVNFGAIGLGNVTYGDVSLDGLALPEEFSLGIAWQPRAQTLVSFKLSWLGWADAVSTLVLDARAPDKPAAPKQLRSEQTLAWHDRTVIALGLWQEVSPRTALLAGFNYGRRPMDDETLSPIFAPIGQKHLTLGLSHRLGENYELSAGLEYQFPERVLYANPQLPFGAGVEVRVEYIALQAMLSHRW